MTLSARINAMFTDPNRDDAAFWELLKSYIGRTCNGLVSQDLIEDLTQDVLVQVFTNLSKFSHNPAHEGSSFTRWVCGIAYRRSLDIKRAFYGAREVPASQVGTWLDDEIWGQTDISALAPTLSDVAYEEALDAEVWPDCVDSTLDAIRASIAPRDVALFDATRRIGEVAPAARETGVFYGTAKNRIHAWSKLIDSPGVHQSSTDGLPTSSRPDGRLSFACVLGNKAALAIAESWRFNRPVRSMPAAEFDELAGRGYTTFTA